MERITPCQHLHSEDRHDVERAMMHRGAVDENAAALHHLADVPQTGGEKTWAVKLQAVSSSSRAAGCPALQRAL